MSINRLWVRLSLVFSIVTLIGVLVFGLLPRLFVNVSVSNLMIHSRLIEEGGLVDRLAELYGQDGQWREALTVLREYDLILPRGFGGDPTTLILASANGRILYDAFDVRGGVPLSEAERADAFPVEVDGVIRGYVTLQTVDIGLPPADTNFLLRELLNMLLLFAVLVGVLGVLAGVIASRQLTAPLNQLSSTVREFGKTNLKKRAEVTGTVEVRQVAAAFNEMADALSEAEMLRRNLVADVAHELRTPLSVLQANLQAILDDVYPLNKTEIQNLQNQTDLLRRLVSDLHELAQAEAHQLPMQFNATDLNDLVLGTTERFHALAGQQGVALKTVLPDEPVYAQVDPDRIAQVLNNLIQNAITHTPEDGTVTISLGMRGDQPCLEVADTGSGIAEVDQSRVFERFFRTDHSRSRSSGGAGLGLAIAKAIVEMHQGTIEVRSAGITGLGATFTILLPSAPVNGKDGTVDARGHGAHENRVSIAK